MAIYERCGSIETLVLQQDFLYSRALAQDYAEGTLIYRAFDRRNRWRKLQNLPVLTAKQIFLAFHHRWRIESTTEEYVAIPWVPVGQDGDRDENSGGGEELSWSVSNNPGENDSVASDEATAANESVEETSGNRSLMEKQRKEIIKDDFGGDLNACCEGQDPGMDTNVNALQFIVRVCSHNHPKTCGFLRWKPRLCGSDGGLLGEDHDELTIDYAWSENETQDCDNGEFPRMPNDICRVISEMVKQQSLWSYMDSESEDSDTSNPDRRKSSDFNSWRVTSARSATLRSNSGASSACISSATYFKRPWWSIATCQTTLESIIDLFLTSSP